MPTIISHAAIPIAAAVALGSTSIPTRLVVAGVLASVSPDFDIVAFKLGIAYADSFGHRGASHSLAFALVLALLAAAGGPLLRASRLTAFCFVLVAAASHPLLDMLTNGGLGVALFWPISEQRWFAPWQVIEVSPIAVRRVFSERGLAVFRSELFWIWLPCAATAAMAAAVHRLRSRRATEPQG